MSRTRRVAQRLVEIFDYRTFFVAGVFVVILLVGYVMFSAFQAAHDSTVAANQRGKAASSRIDGLQQQIRNLPNARVADARAAALRDAQIRVLEEQLRRMNGRPITVVMPSASPAPSPRPTTTASPVPRPRPTSSTRPSPTPSPSPIRTCRLPIFGCL